MPQTIEFKVTGMTCGHCVHAVTTAVEEVPGVTSVAVSLEEGSARVKGAGIDPAAVVAAIREEGYDAAVASSA